MRKEAKANFVYCEINIGKDEGGFVIVKTINYITIKMWMQHRLYGGKGHWKCKGILKA